MPKKTLKIEVSAIKIIRAMKKISTFIIGAFLYMISMAGFAQWNQVGFTIVGDAEDDNLGVSVSLSAGGTTLAVGAPWAGNSGEGYVKESI